MPGPRLVTTFPSSCIFYSIVVAVEDNCSLNKGWQVAYFEKKVCKKKKLHINTLFQHSELVVATLKPFNNPQDPSTNAVAAPIAAYSLPSAACLFNITSRVPQSLIVAAPMPPFDISIQNNN